MSVERAVSAGAWSALDVALRQVVLFAVSIILARILTPTDFGIVALTNLFSSFVLVFVQGGLSAALIQQQDTTSQEESAVFWLNLFASVGFALLLVAIAPLVAEFYGYPVLRSLMPVAGAAVVFSALESRARGPALPHLAI